MQITNIQRKLTPLAILAALGSPHSARLPYRLSLGALALAALLIGGSRSAAAQADDPLDPAHNLPLPCEALSTPGAVPRSARNLAHLANVCGFVGTDVEFQSRTASDGLRDYAFLGTMGYGLRIFDVTDPAHPVQVGGYADPGWQGDVQVRGDLAVISFDPIAGTAPTASACLQAQGASGGVDVIRLGYDPATATFQTALLDCISGAPSGGAHNSTLHPSGEWLAMSNPRTQGSVDVVDLRGAAPVLRYRIVQEATLTSTACTQLAPPVACISNGRAGTWSPHDLHFSADGDTMYVAAVFNDTVIVDVSDMLNGQVSTIGVVPNDPAGDGVANDPHDIQIAHQSDVSADGSMLVVTDERGGGVQETRCNTDANGIIGGMHFWALAPIQGIPQSDGASPADPQRIGGWFYPNPTLAVDPLEPVLATLPRTERACTIHVFRLGGNGTASPGPIHPDFDGVSRLDERRTVAAHYGAGVWYIDFSAAPDPTDGIEEEARSTWGNTLGWNVMPGAETWSAKEYKGFIYAGDMSRGFDVYRFADCEAIECVTPPPISTPGKATGGGQLDGDLAELTVLRGTTAGGKANFGFSAEFAAGDLAPTGQLTFIDHGAGKKVKSTVIESYAQIGNRASLTGRAEVNGVPGIAFFVEVEDFGEPGDADLFRIVLGDGYGAAGVLAHGNIQVHSEPP